MIPQMWAAARTMLSRIGISSRLIGTADKERSVHWEPSPGLKPRSGTQDGLGHLGLEQLLDDLAQTELGQRRPFAMRFQRLDH